MFVLLALKGGLGRFRRWRGAYFLQAAAAIRPPVRGKLIGRLHKFLRTFLTAAAAHGSIYIRLSKGAEA